MDPADARRIFALPQDEAEPVLLPVSVLSKLTIDDVPDGGSFEVGTMQDGVVHLDWSGTLTRLGDIIVGEAYYTWTRKYWYSPLGLEQT